MIYHGNNAAECGRVQITIHAASIVELRPAREREKDKCIYKKSKWSTPDLYTPADSVEGEGKPGERKRDDLLQNQNGVRGPLKSKHVKAEWQSTRARETQGVRDVTWLPPAQLLFSAMARLQPPGLGLQG